MTVLIYDYSGIGDVYVFCLYIKANYDEIAEGKFVVTVNNRVLCKIFELFELKNYFLVSELNAKHLTHFSLAAPDTLNIRNITPFPRYNFTDLSFRFGGIFLNMADMYKYQMFNLPETATIEYPVLKPDHGEVEKLFENNGLIPGRTVILSSEAKTCAGCSDIFGKTGARTKTPGVCCLYQYGGKKNAITHDNPNIIQNKVMIDFCAKHTYYVIHKGAYIVFFSDDFTHPSSILQFTAAAERRGIKPYRLAPNKKIGKKMIKRLMKK